MKQIRVLKQFTLQVHQMDMRTFQANKTYEVDDDIANNWWVRAHAEVLGEPPVQPLEGESVEEAVKGPVPHTKFQKPLEMAPVPSKKAAKGSASSPALFEPAKEESASE